jgi:hypothetical protein
MPFGHLGDLCLGQQDHIGGHFAAGGHSGTEGGGELVDARALGVPRKTRIHETQFGCQESRHGRTGIAVSVQRPGGTSELDGQPGTAQLAQLRRDRVERGQPPRRTRPEGGRHRRLAERPRDHRSIAVRFGQGGGGFGGGAQVVENRA